MKFGIGPYSFEVASGQSQADVYRETFEQIRVAEENGFDSAWVSEHHFLQDGYLPSLLVAAAAVAARTTKIKIGTGCILLPFYHPVAVAEEASVVDIISGGRLILGLGRGSVATEFEGFGLDLAQHRNPRFEEGMEILTKCWTEERFSYTGKQFTVKDVSLYPRPVQKPHPPIWIAAVLGRALKWAGKHGFVFMGGAPVRLGFLQWQYDVYRQALRAAGKDPAQVETPIIREVYVAEDGKKAWEEFEPAVMYTYKGDYMRWGYLFDRDGSLMDRPDHPGYQTFREDFCIVGDPAECIREIKRYQQELGVTYIICRTQFPGLAHEKILRSTRLFAREVAPAFA